MQPHVTIASSDDGRHINIEMTVETHCVNIWGGFSNCFPQLIHSSLSLKGSYQIDETDTGLCGLSRSQSSPTQYGGHLALLIIIKLNID